MRPGAPRRRERTRMGRRPARHTSLCEALNRVLDTGAVVMGELVISVAGVDLLYLNLNLLLCSVETLLEAQERSVPRVVTGIDEDRPLLEVSSVGTTAAIPGVSACEATGFRD